MPVAYPAAIRPPLRASRTRTQAASFSASDPTRGFARFERTGFDQPVSWDLTWRFPAAEAQLFMQWFVYETLRGALPFTIDLRTEFGLIQHECRFMPGGLLNARQDGATWVYTATIMARAQIIPAPAVTAYGGAFVGPIPAQTVNTGSPFTLNLTGYWSGGLGPFTWAIASGMLPPGVELNASTGVVSGTWTGTSSTAFNGVVFARKDLFGVRRYSDSVDFTAFGKAIQFVAATINADPDSPFEIPSHQPNDFILALAKGNSGATTLPGLPAGWTNIVSSASPANFGGAKRIYGIRDAGGTLAQVVDPTGRTGNIMFLIYRNVAGAGLSVFPLDVLGPTSGSTPALGALSIGSWVVAGVDINQASNITGPAGLTVRSTRLISAGGGTGSIADSNGVRSAYAGGDVFTWGAGAYYGAYAVELLLDTSA
jgi:hypothetical protein